MILRLSQSQAAEERFLVGRSSWRGRPGQSSTPKKCNGRYHQSGVDEGCLSSCFVRLSNRGIS